MIDQAGEDPVQVQAAADVAGDPPQGLRSMEEMADLLLAVCHADHRPDRRGEHPGKLDIGRSERFAGGRDHEQHAPWAVGPRDRDGQLGVVARQPGQRHAFARTGDPDRSASRAQAVALGRRGIGLRRAEDPSADPERSEGRAAAGWRYPVGTAAAFGASRSPRSSQATTRAWPAVSRMACTIRSSSPSRSLEPAASRVMTSRRPRSRRWRSSSSGSAGDPSRAAIGRPVGSDAPGRWPPTAQRARPEGAPGGLGRLALGSRQEPLEVAESVAAIAPRVDPVVAQPARVAPGAHGVRMDTQDPRGLGHRQRRVGRAGRDRRSHRELGGTVRFT